MSKSYHIYEGTSSKPGKIYFSRVSTVDEWELWDFSSYRFPYADRIARMKYGLKILGAYFMFRLFLENLWEKKHR